VLDKIMLITDSNTVTSEAEGVWILEGPEGCWATWVRADSHTSVALPIPQKSDRFECILDTQKRIMNKIFASRMDDITLMKVPECSDYAVESGQAAICECTWPLCSSVQSNQSL